jgi:hypothetical protein
MSANSADVKFAVRKKNDGTGCYIIAGPKPDASAPKRGRKVRKAEQAEPAA